MNVADLASLIIIFQMHKQKSGILIYFLIGIYTSILLVSQIYLSTLLLLLTVEEIIESLT